MSASRRAVKTGRRYDSSGRRRQAELTRARVLDVARRRFLADGYAATTVAAIADVAGVSVETIYKAYGGKVGLVRALHDAALLGPDPVPPYRRADEMGAHVTDPRELVRGWGRLLAEVSPRGAPIMLLVRDAAATDPEMAALRREIEDARLTRMTFNAGHLREHLRRGVTVQRAGEVLFAYTAPELFELLVLRQGWPPEDFGRFVAQGIAASLLGPAPL